MKDNYELSNFVLLFVAIEVSVEVAPAFSSSILLSTRILLNEEQFLTELLFTWEMSSGGLSNARVSLFSPDLSS